MDGKAHYTANLLSGAAMVLFAAAEMPAETVVPVLIGSAAGTFITPDYDFEHNLPKWKIGRVPVLGPLWNLLWYPYALLVKHRSFVSHSPVFGTLGRIGYLLGVALFTCWVMGSLWQGAEQWLPMFVNWLSAMWDSGIALLIIVPWCVQDIVHLTLDLPVWKRR